MSIETFLKTNDSIYHRFLISEIVIGSFEIFKLKKLKFNIKTVPFCQHYIKFIWSYYYMKFVQIYVLVHISQTSKNSDKV